MIKFIALVAALCAGLAVAGIMAVDVGACGGPCPPTSTTTTTETPPPPFLCPDGLPPEENPVDPNDNCKRPESPPVTTTPPVTTPPVATTPTPVTPPPVVTTAPAPSETTEPDKPKPQSEESPPPVVAEGEEDFKAPSTSNNKGEETLPLTS